MPTTLSIGGQYSPEGPISVFEGDAGSTPAVFRINRTGDLQQSNTVRWTVFGTGSTPVDGADFMGGVLPSGVAAFMPGYEVVEVTLQVAGDKTFENFETFGIILTDPTNGALLGSSVMLGELYSDDHTMALSPATVSLVEGNDGATAYSFDVDYRPGGSNSGFGVDWVVTGSGANPATADDFVGGVFPSGSVGYWSRHASGPIQFSVAGDRTFEGDEGFTVTLINPRGSGMTLLNASADGVIRNDDAAPPVVQPPPVVVTPPPPVVVVEPAQPTPAPVVPPPITANLTSTTAQVVRLYEATLDRIPEPAGVVFYRSLLDSGQDTLATLVDNFTGSPEFVAKYGNATNEQLVELLYRNVLSREGSVADVDWYEARMAEGSMTRDTVVIGFSQSPENIQLTARDVQFVVDHYGIG